jgi:hypothetical protein
MWHSYLENVMTTIEYVKPVPACYFHFLLLRAENFIMHIDVKSTSWETRKQGRTAQAWSTSTM